MFSLWLGSAAGILQVLGYGLYIRHSHRKELDPNAATWFMFAYGTALLAVLEYSRGAQLDLLYLPIACAILSIVVAFICWKRGTLRWPEEWQDQLAFYVDIVLTIFYAVAWALAISGILDAKGLGYANLIFLICSNLTTISSFSPLMRAAHRKESSLPWAVWASAYAALAVATFAKHGLLTDLMIYPVLNAVLHGRVAWLARHRQTSHIHNTA